MDVLRLDATSYIADELIEGYSTMIWTERYLNEGEFEMKTPLVSKIRDALPEGQPISLLDSNEVMLVETHSIGVDSDGAPELTVKGRSFETSLENRCFTSMTGEPWPTIRPYTTAELSTLLLWTHLVNSTGEDPTRMDTTIDAFTQVANVVITDSVYFSEERKSWSLEAGVAYKAFLEFLDLADLGVRNIRPYLGSTGSVVAIDTTATGTRGTIQKFLVSNIPSLRVDVYSGFDRTRSQFVNEPVVFRYDAGYIDDPGYLFSNKELKVMAKVSTSLGSVDVWPETGLVPPTPEPTGLDRRILYMDGGPKDEEQTEEDFMALIVQKAQIELKKHNRTMVFDGSISPIAPYKYNEEYFLGDKVTLKAEYGFEASMRVAEYVRTEDDEGDRGYPTLILAS